MRRVAPINPTAHLLQFFAGGLPALLAVLALLLVESVSETDPKSTAKQDAKNGNNDAVGLGAAVFRVIETGTAVRCFVVRHERTGEGCLLYTSPSPRDLSTSRMPSSA